MLTCLQVGEYMTEMLEDSEENYNKHFSKYIEAGLEGEELEDTMKEVGCPACEGLCQCLQGPATGHKSFRWFSLACWCSKDLGSTSTNVPRLAARVIT